MSHPTPTPDARPEPGVSATVVPLADTVTTPPAPTVIVGRLHDPLIERISIDVTHPYVDELWLPTIGPSALWLLRHLDTRVARHGEGVEVSLAELAEAIGVGRGIGRHAPIQRTLRRLVHFGLATWHHTYKVRSHLPPLTARYLDRLSVALRHRHDALLAEHHHRLG